MAATFRSVNSTLTPNFGDDKVAPPTTPRPRTAPHPSPHPSPPDSSNMMNDDSTTPTRATFSSGSLAAQKPLPTSPFPDAVQIPESADETIPERVNSQRSRKSRDSDDMDRGDSDGEGHVEDGAGSDEESVNADGSRSNKKKRSQRFYCTEYPPCNLSFTRSEHLARHIRKHTGERPFQCHCSRRFSRLDNLRQHAQTVHVNEDIPIDSLAATGTRFQRQIRTERVRQAGGRSRASTAGSTGSTARGHSKSLSTSSIASIGSIGSSYSLREDTRRRPAPIIMADPRSRLSIESYRSGPEQPQVMYRPPSPSDFSTPTSATFSTGQGSPRWGSTVASPISSHSRTHSMYTTGSRTPGRRLSVPSGANPFQSPHRTQMGQALGPGPMNSSNSAVFSSPHGSLLASPTTSTSSWTRRDSTSSAADDPWRRRTWHPDSRDYAGASRFGANQYPSNAAPLPISNPAAQQQGIRLPGIESFDPIPHRPLTPPRRNPSPMMIDSEMANPPTLLPAAEIGMEERRGAAMWDMGLHRGLTRLEIASRQTPPRDGAGAWAHEVNQAVQARAEHVRSQPTVRFETEVQTVPPPIAPAMAPAGIPGNGHVRGHAHTMSAPAFSTPREMKRHGWYHGPSSIHSRVLAVEETIMERPAERGPHVDRMVHPNVNGFTGFPARDQQGQQQPNGGHAGNADSLKRLEALVAVATSEGSTATAY